MISIYSQNNTEYTKNGDAVLIPTKCELALTINGAWQLTLGHPYDPEERYKYIIEGAVIQCDIKCIRELPTVKQRFRIYTYTKGLNGITAIAFPIAMESTYDAPIDNLVISGKTGAQAMALIQAFTNKYTLFTDVTKTASASMSNTNVNSAIASGNSNSFIGAWGGEILYSNYDYMVKSRLGDNVAGDHRIIYGRNLTDIEYKKDDSGLTTRIYPISEDGIRLNGTGYVDSPKISDYPVIHHRFMQAPYNLIDTDASSASATAQQTRTSLAAISTAATTLSQGVDISSYPPEYIKQQRADIVAAVQTMALNGVISTSLYNAAAKTISDAMAWMNNLAQPEWDWMGSYEAGWKYGNSDGYAVSQYIKIGKTWRYFGANGNWQEPADSSNEWDWYQSTEETGKKYGDFSRYYAHNEYVFITLSGQLKQYWFNEEGWYEEDESGDSDYAWNGSGTSEDPWWFGESSSKYLKSCWAFIDGTYYFFDEYGYYDGSTKLEDFQWDWVDDGSRAWFGNPDHEFAAYYLTNQWCKIDGSWYYFNNDGYVYDDNAARANVTTLYTTGMASLATTVSTQATALYTLLYSLMTAYAQSKFDSGVDMPYITITVNMADLSKTTEYAGYENLETVKLGDSVECIDNEHDISMTNRVIGLTYDVIRDYNSEVVLGNAAATVASIVGNANGQAVAGGFDTSAIESQLDSLQNKMGDFLVNGASVVTNGVGQLNLQAGDNISISRDGRTLTISGEGGGALKYFEETSQSLYGEQDLSTRFVCNPDYYFDYAVTEHLGQIADPKVPIRKANDIPCIACASDFLLPGQTTPYDAETVGWLYGGGIIWVSPDPEGTRYIVSDTDGTDVFEGGYFYGNNHIPNEPRLSNYAYQFTFADTTWYASCYAYNSGYNYTALVNDGHIIRNDWQSMGEDTFAKAVARLMNGVNIAVNKTAYSGLSRTTDLALFIGGTDANGTDAPIKFYGDGTYEGIADDKQDKLTAGANIQIAQDGTISATDTTYSAFVGTDGQTAGAAGLVPAPTVNDANKYLKGDGTWAAGGSGGSSVIANPSGTPTDTLQTVEIDGTIYEIEGGAGGDGISSEIIKIATGDGTTSRTFTFSKEPKRIAISWYEGDGASDWASSYAFTWGDHRAYGFGGNTNSATSGQYPKVASITYGQDGKSFTITAANPGGACNTNGTNDHGYLWVDYGTGGGSELTEIDLWTNTTGAGVGTYTLSNSIDDYDFIAIYYGVYSEYTSGILISDYRLVSVKDLNQLHTDGKRFLVTGWNNRTVYLDFNQTTMVISVIENGNTVLKVRGIKIGGGGGGSDVEANPQDTPTDTLETIKIGDTVYDIAGNAGGGVSSELVEFGSGDGTTSRTFQLSKTPKKIIMSYFEGNDDNGWASQYVLVWGEPRAFGTGTGSPANTGGEPKTVGITYGADNKSFTVNASNVGSAMNTTSGHGYLYLDYGTGDNGGIESLADYTWTEILSTNGASGALPSNHNKLLYMAYYAGTVQVYEVIDVAEMKKAMTETSTTKYSISWAWNDNHGNYDTSYFYYDGTNVSIASGNSGVGCKLFGANISSNGNSEIIPIAAGADTTTRTFTFTRTPKKISVSYKLTSGADAGWAWDGAFIWGDDRVFGLTLNVRVAASGGIGTVEQIDYGADGKSFTITGHNAFGALNSSVGEGRMYVEY